ncbi:MAG: hypothetical protein JNM17_34390, partial [Archangium sp.]|nr:hypothetical protein [Archangium sp.]
MVLALLLLPFVLGLGVLTFLRTSAGSAFLKRQVLEVVHSNIEGKLDVESITLEGNHVVLTKLRLYTPEGVLVASIERVEADVALRALANERLELSAVKVEEPKLFLVNDNFQRATAPADSSADLTATRGVSEKAKKAERNGWVVKVADFALSDGRVEVHQPGRDIVTQSLTVSGNALVALSPLRLSGKLDGRAKVTAPLEDDLVITTEASSEDSQHATLSITLGESLVKAGLNGSAEQVTLEQLTLSPRELKAFVPDWPVKPTILGRGTLSLTQSSLEFSAGKARAIASARYSLDAHAITALEVKANGVDLQELVGAELPSEVDAHLTGKIDDWRTDTLAGNLKGTATWLAKGERLFDATLDANAVTGALEVKQLTALGSGLELKARGKAAPGTLSLFGNLEVKDLSQLDKSLRTFANIDTGGLSGTGKVQLMAKGPLSHPSITVMGELKNLHVSELQMEQLSLNIELPDAAKPLDTDILLHSKRVRWGERVFDEVTLDFLTRGRDIDLDFTTRGMGDLQAHLIGKLDADRRGAVLTACDLKWTGATWSLESPTSLKWGDDFELQPLLLHDENRRLSVRVKRTRKALDAELHAQQLDLAKLPSALAPPSWELGGTVTSLDIDVSGTPDVPIVAVKTVVKDGRVWAVTGLQLTGDAKWNDGRLTGVLAMESDVGHVDGDFDVPLIGLRDEKPEPARAHFTVRELKSAFLEQKLERTLPFTGALSGTLDLTGTGERPNVVATVTAPKLDVATRVSATDLKQPKQKDRRQPLTLTDSTLVLRTLDDGTVTATFDTHALGGTHHVSGSAPVTLSSLRKKERTRDDWLSLPFTLDFDLQHLVLLEALALNGETDDELAGDVSFTGHISGTPRAPEGHVGVAVRSLTFPPLRDADLNLAITAESGRTRFTGDGSLKNVLGGGKTKAVDFTATVGATPERALAALFAAKDGDDKADAVITALKDTRVDALVTMSPFDLTEVLRREGSGAGR